MNGTYGQTQSQGYDQSYNSQTGATSSQSNGDYSSTATSTTATTNGTSAATGTEIPKDEVGWYFVEQYYTTLSRSPEKLFVGKQIWMIHTLVS